MHATKSLSKALLPMIFLAGYLVPSFSEEGKQVQPADSARDASTRLASRKKSQKANQRSPEVARVTQGRGEAGPEAGKTASVAEQATPKKNEVALLKEVVTQQQTQIQELLRAVEELKKRLDGGGQSTHTASAQTPNLGMVASLVPRIAESKAADAVRPALSATPPPGAAPATRGEVQEYTTKVDELSKKMDGALKNLGGFKFGGDFRFRADAQLRSSNAIAGPLQNLRSRYRLRLNVDKELDPRFKLHFQLSTGSVNNAITNDQDFAATAIKHPFSIAEAYVDFHPSSKFALRGGRMEEIFADNMRFLWDDDVRFNGFQQIATIPVGANALGIKSVELRSGEYILSNPNVAILSSTSPFVTAGFTPGKKVRDANLFHPGFVVKGDLGTGWSHQFTSDIQVYRNPNQIQLASLANGFPVLISNGIGLALSGPVTGTGNATTTSGGAIYSAPNFQIARLAYRLERKGWKIGKREMPAYLDFQASRNIGTSKLRDAVMASANLGAVKGFGDVRFLYQFAIKDANSLISQFTDDDLATGTGVNIKVHAVRFDLGLTRFLQWQNLLFIQDERRPSNPAQQFFVPLQRGASTNFRYLGQLAFTF